ncbi:C40 family peptidase [Fulvivirga imtechensis]|nr:C40 family peptidase [Fulvivirga imtechensis]
MNLLKVILKDKLFYVVLAVIFIVSSAMQANRNNNSDLLEAYYYPNDTIVSESGSQGATLRDSLVAYAMTLQGKPYKYAGKGPSVFDCSGFTCYVYSNFNIQLPASSALQAKHGEFENTEDVQKGDLLIFKSPANGVNRVGHVGMVVSNENGKIQFIHSSTGRGVVIDSLDHRHYKARYMGARKVLAD